MDYLRTELSNQDKNSDLSDSTKSNKKDLPEDAVEAFSKKFDHSINPNRDFAAIMTCSEADKNCPFIPGAALRIPIRYQDPKVYDGTPQASEQYEATAQLIAKEMLYVFSQIAAS